MSEFGRIRRTTFLLRMVILIIIDIGIYYLIDINNPDYQISIIIFYFILLLAKLSQIVLRLHDMNMSGWYSLCIFVPIVNLLILGLFIIEGTIGQNKYGADPKARGTNVKTESNLTKHENSSFNERLSVEEIDQKLELIEDGFNNGLFTTSEYESKKRNFEVQKEKLNQQNVSLKTAKINEEKLRQLLLNGIISLDEFKTKLSLLNSNVMEYNYGVEELNSASRLIYISQGKQYGPVSANKIIELLKSGQINPNCLVKHENESTFNKRAKDLLITDG